MLVRTKPLHFQPIQSHWQEVDADKDGTIASYLWTKISGPSAFNIANSASAATDVSGLVQGVYTFELKVTDDKGATATSTVQVTVNAATNVAPTANAGADRTITLPTNTISLAGSGADKDGTIASYLWTKISGPSAFNIVNSASAATDVSGLVQGVYTFELKVTDDKGATATSTVQVTVNAATNVAPTANAGADKTITLPTNTISLAGSGADKDGTIASYLWTKISGPSAFNIVNSASAATDVSGLVQGVYTFELKVTDDKGATATSTVNSNSKRSDERCSYSKCWCGQNHYASNQYNLTGRKWCRQGRHDRFLSMDKDLRTISLQHCKLSIACNRCFRTGSGSVYV